MKENARKSRRSRSDCKWNFWRHSLYIQEFLGISLQEENQSNRFTDPLRDRHASIRLRREPPSPLHPATRYRHFHRGGNLGRVSEHSKTDFNYSPHDFEYTSASGSCHDHEDFGVFRMGSPQPVFDGSGESLALILQKLGMTPREEALKTLAIRWPSSYFIIVQLTVLILG